MYESIADEVIRYLKEYEMQNYSYCAFFDIDDTLIHSETQLPITSIVNVYNECKKLNICLFIITARTDSLFTYYQLYSVGIKGWGGIYFFPSNYIYNEETVASFKENARLEAINQGYVPIFSIGDKIWDIGTYGGRGFLLKNEII